MLSQPHDQSLICGTQLPQNPDRTENAQSTSGRLALSRALRRALAWKCPPNWSAADWRDEARAIGLLALVQAATDYDEHRGVAFSDFATKRIQARVFTRYRQEWSYARRTANENVAARGRPMLERPHGADDRNLDLERLQQALDHLSTSDAELLRCLYLQGRTESEEAGRLGISQQAVSKRKLSALRRIRDILGRGSNRG